MTWETTIGASRQRTCTRSRTICARSCTADFALRIKGMSTGTSASRNTRTAIRISHPLTMTTAISGCCSSALSLCYTTLRFRFDQHMKDHRCDDDRATDDGPARRPFAEEKKDPDRIQDGFDVTDDAGIKRADTAGHRQSEKQISESDLHHSEVGHACGIHCANVLQSGETGRRCDEDYQNIPVDHRRGSIDVSGGRMTQ